MQAEPKDHNQTCRSVGLHEAFSEQNISQYFCLWELETVTSVLVLQQNKLLAYVEVERNVINLS